MAQTAPSPDRTVNPAGSSPLVPPDERFWQRYSPHAEFPLSSVSSFAIHALFFGIFALLAFLSMLLFNQGNRQLPVEAVRWDAAGGGGGHPRGEGDGPNRGAPVEAAGPTKGDAEENKQGDDLPPVKPLNLPANPRIAPNFDSNSQRVIQMTDTATARAFSNLNRVTSNLRLTEPKTSGRGKGGPGSGGGSGGGEGAGVGDGRGDGHGTLTKREKRMIRWVMGFNPLDAQDYLGQLQGLGAILAVPIREHANPGDYQPSDYRLIHNLSGRPPKLRDEDMSKLNRIYWYDTEPNSAAGVMKVLRLPQRPSHFIAFMPKELEDKLYAMEDAYLKANHPGRTEEDVVKTRFKIKHNDGKYEPVLESVKVK